jgi:hypothetical protein
MKSDVINWDSVTGVARLRWSGGLMDLGVLTESEVTQRAWLQNCSLFKDRVFVFGPAVKRPSPFTDRRSSDTVFPRKSCGFAR